MPNPAQVHTLQVLAGFQQKSFKSIENWSRQGQSTDINALDFMEIRVRSHGSEYLGENTFVLCSAADADKKYGTFGSLDDRNESIKILDQSPANIPVAHVTAVQVL
jgi:hypothetical protein